MAVNASSSTNDSLLHPNIHLAMDCLVTRPSSFIFITFFITNILLFLPLFILVLYLGFQRWRQQRSTSTATTTSHSDSFTYHMVAIEVVGVLGCILCCWGAYGDHVAIFMMGYYLWSTTWYGETFFHILTCVERYLAVVHPITYLSLRRERGIRIRNITIGCAWLLCFGASSLFILEGIFIIIDICLLIFSLIVIAFCSLAVLCVLIRPGPGEQGGDRERVDQSKRRAFYTLVAILGVLLLRCFGSLVWAIIHVLGESSECVIMTVEIWVNVPNSLVIPLLFLLRAGMLACCKNGTK